MIKVYEFGKHFEVPKDECAALKTYLHEVWQRRFANEIEEEISEEQEITSRQSFLTFHESDTKASAKNYVGFIQSGELHIEIYPKVFKNHDHHDANAKLFLKHLFYWFGYCRKWKFPITNVNLDSLDHDNLPELIIKLIADCIHDTIAASPISLYEEVEESLMMPRGRINFGRYITNGLSTGNHHILECDYEPLVYDNKLNRAIKYVTRILQSLSKFDETKNRLNDIIFILDEVEDVPCMVQDLDKIKINSFFTDYQLLIDLCRLILEQQLYSNNHYEQHQWCLLFPMEYIFEDFVAGFLEYHFKDWNVEYQKSDKYLATNTGNSQVFQMRHDIFLTHKVSKIEIIVDAKYKPRDPKTFADPKKGIAQSDMYQITSYAFRRGCNHVLLIYPNFSEGCCLPDFFNIQSGFANRDNIEVIAAEIPFWSMNNFEQLTKSLEQRFRMSLDAFS